MDSHAMRNDAIKCRTAMITCRYTLLKEYASFVELFSRANALRRPSCAGRDHLYPLILVSSNSGGHVDGALPTDLSQKALCRWLPHTKACDHSRRAPLLSSKHPAKIDHTAYSWRPITCHRASVICSLSVPSRNPPGKYGNTLLLCPQHHRQLLSVVYGLCYSVYAGPLCRS